MDVYKSFVMTAAQVLRDANDAHSISGVIVVNFEGLPELDGALGYDEVDETLAKLVLKVRDALASTDVVGSSGRYQICCLLADLLTQAHAELAAHKLLRLLTPTILVKDRRVSLLPRIGLALNNSKKNNLSQLMRNASAGLYQARRNKKHIGIFDAAERNKLLSGMDIWSELDRATQSGELELVYQPQLWAASGKLRSTEALLRWNHPTRGTIPPDKLLQFAEGTELMFKLTLWVINTAFRQCAEYRRAGLEAGVAINLSAGDISEPELVEVVEQMLDIWGVCPENVIMELTETAIMEDNPASLESLNGLKKIGFKLAMDDFGTGYSSMERLLVLPLDEIKIDKLFVKNMTTQPAHERIVSSVINMGHQLGLKVVAEGVEDVATHDRLRKLGCDVIQGFLIGSGLPLAELIQQIDLFNDAKK
jgi:EAL domain-containing protein (putative c-di-GMP-specific phosphodiesterase class I)/GGDEF domain-containing protein